MPWLGTQSTSKAHWSNGDRILIGSYGSRTKAFDPQNGQRDRLMWIDLETSAAISDEVPSTSSNMRDVVAAARNQAIEAARGTAWGLLAMDGELGGAVVPSFSHAGDRIAYVSTDKSPDGHPDYTATLAAVFTVPFNARMGGSVSPLAGAADPNFYQNYPAFSADDKLIAFSRSPKRGSCPACADGPYYNRFSEIYVPSAGERQIACPRTTQSLARATTSQGLLNSWPKWSLARCPSAEDVLLNDLLDGPNAPGNFDIREDVCHTTLDALVQLRTCRSRRRRSDRRLTSYPGVYLWNGIGCSAAA
jgi:hypothetical protein